MSNDAADEHNSYVPARAPAKAARLTLDEMKDVAAFFKTLFEDSSLAVWIKVAGVGAAIEGLHIVWLMIRYIARF